MGKDPIFGLILSAMFLAISVEGEIRCYCNEVGCVQTGYMCKSQLGICYSLVKYKDSNIGQTGSNEVHGCADTLEQEPRIRTCAGQPLHHNEAELNQNGTESQTVTNSVEKPEPIIVQNSLEKAGDYTNSVDPDEPHLTCCTQDMCNYKDSVDIQISIGSHSNEGKDISQERLDETDKPHKDLWFKAAVIAVPIAGGFILILLVLLAVRMLRSDSRHHRRLIQIRRERSLTKAQLYVTDHFIEKDINKGKYTSDNHSNQHNINHNNHVHQAHPRDPNCERSHSVPHRHSNSHHQQHQQNRQHHHQNKHHNHHHNHKNNNCPKITTNKDGHTYEQIVTQVNDVNSNNCENICQTSYPSIVVWGQPPKQDIAAVV